MLAGPPTGNRGDSDFRGDARIAPALFRPRRVFKSQTPLTSAAFRWKVPRMLAYIARRLLWTPFLLIFVSLFVFTLGLYGPGDPVEVRLGQNYTPERAERLRDQLGLNDSFFTQYVRYVSNALKGDFGESLRFQGQKVTQILGPKIWVSVQLNVIAFAISLGVGLPLGFYVAKRQGSWQDPVVVFTALVLYALPVFITAPFLVWIFALELHWVPTAGWGGFLDKRIILPAVVIGIPGIAVFVRLMRASTLDILGQDYIRTARAKGLSEFTVNARHTGRNALLPIVTVTFFSLAGLLGGALVVELIFGVPGVGRLSLEAITARDYNVVMALTIMGATALVVANLLMDIAYTVVDPRIRLQ